MIQSGALKSALFITLACLTLSACLGHKTIGREAVKRLTGPTQMIARDINVNGFDLTLHERIHDRGGFAHIYIEGDDDLIGKSSSLSQDMIALQLAARDKAKNLIHITRPCQFTRTPNMWQRSKTANKKQACDVKYLSTHRFDSHVIKAYSQAFDNIKARWGIKGFHVYAHSGGAGIGALLAAERGDILSLTTVSAILDVETYNDTLNAADLIYNDQIDPQHSISPLHVARHLSNLPQYHYIGLSTKGITPAILYNYLHNIGATNCVQYKLIQENGYKAGWSDKWGEILSNPPTCRGPRKILFADKP